jgi:hypothetical protein
MLNWETVDPEAIYPNPRFRAYSEKRHYSIFAQQDVGWHLHMTPVRTFDQYGDGRGDGQARERSNFSTLDDAKRDAEEWERRAVRAQSVPKGT